ARLPCLSLLIHLSVSSSVEGNLGEWKGHLRHGMEIRVRVLSRQCPSLNASARWSLSAREMVDPRGRAESLSASLRTVSVHINRSTVREELIAVFSLSFPISPALSPPLSLKLMCGVTVKPPRPVHSSTLPHPPGSLRSVCTAAPPQLSLSSQSHSATLN
ncbi:unnamed protein product, partial [Pleuronectes platessa]